LFDRRYNASHRERLPNKRLMRSRWYQAPRQMLVFPIDAKICVHLQNNSPLAIGRESAYVSESFSGQLL
jgi:hypothetical protein